MELTELIEGKPFLLMVLRKNYDIANARFFVRMGRESAESISAGCFRMSLKILRLPLVQRYAIPIRLPQDCKTTFVEILDASQDISCLYTLCNKEFSNPYHTGEQKETIVEMEMDEGKSANVENFFLKETYDLTDMSFKFERCGKPTKSDHSSKIKKQLESELRSNNHFFVETPDTDMVSGIYWINEKHWRLINDDGFMTTVAPESLYPSHAAVCMRGTLRQLHLAYLRGLRGEHDAKLPPDYITFPQLPDLLCIPPYVAVHHETVVALATLSHPGFTLDTVKIDYASSGVLSTRRGHYSIEKEIENPLSLWYNKYMRERWGLSEYVRYRRVLNMSSQEFSTNSNEWGRFYVQGGVIVGIVHPEGDVYGEVNIDLEPLNIMRARLRQLSQLPEASPNILDQVLTEGGLGRPSYVCYYNVVNGRMYISHPYFPYGKCLILHSDHLTEKEVELLRGKALKAADSLARYSVIKSK